MIISGKIEQASNTIFEFPRKICTIQIAEYNIIEPKSGCNINNPQIAPIIEIEINGARRLVFDKDKKCAFIIIKNGFINSDGWIAIKPRLNHLCEPLILLPINGTTQSNIKHTKKPRYDKFIIDILDNIEIKVIKNTNNTA